MFKQAARASVGGKGPSKVRRTEEEENAEQTKLQEEQKKLQEEWAKKWDERMKKVQELANSSRGNLYVFFFFYSFEL